MPRMIHIARDGSDGADGTAEAPFRSINQGACIAQPGDTVQVHEGEYREHVDPQSGGLSDTRRIVYEAAPGERVVIKGSEQLTGWQHSSAGVWTATVPKSLFGSWNPFAEPVQGDWVARPRDRSVHLGEVYLNGTAGHECRTLDDVHDRDARSGAVDDWTQTWVAQAEDTSLRWFADVREEETTITAYFGQADPNTELVEINVRPTVFYPSEHHLSFVTVRGFEMCHAAAPWAPPTADQPGLIGPNWAKGWIIEDNEIHHAKCSAISLGKERSTGHNFATIRGDKPGYQYQLESVFTALRSGWAKESIGSHTVRGNVIHDCGQNAIVGHLGCAFSKISDNEIYSVGTKRDFYGYEIAGIKFHAAIDTRVEHNRIYDCSLGIWLDWETQGTRVTRNVLYNNKRDVFIEVSHGPYLVENNVLASPASLEVFSQGGAFIGNLIAGTVRSEPVIDRATPYHVPHSTDIAGYAIIEGADDRFIGNIFDGGDIDAAYHRDQQGGLSVPGYGTAMYNGHPQSFRAFQESVPDDGSDHQKFARLPQPVYIRHNVYLAGAEPFDGEDSPVVLGETGSIVVRDAGTEVWLDLELPEPFKKSHLGPVDGRDLEHVRFPDANFESPDGSPVTINTDLLGQQRHDGSVAGPIGEMKSGRSSTRIW